MLLTPTGTDLFNSLSRAELTRLSVEISELQGQIATGKKDPRPSSDLLGAVQLSAAREREGALDRYGQNAFRASARLDQADVALTDATDIMRRTRDLALQTLTDTVSDEMRQSIAEEVRLLQDALLAVGNTRDEAGNMLFGGLSAATEPFTVVTDPLGLVPDFVTYQGTSAVQQVAVSDSLTIDMGINGQEAFGTGIPNGSFEAMDNFISLLEAGGTPPAGVTRDTVIDGLDAATDRFVDARTRVGALSATAARQSDVISAQQANLDVSISQLEDLDLADAITRLQEALLTRDAAQQTYATIAQRSLFDLLR
ncbi:MAG: flagellar hook-associated protein FlgL [Pseudomonadota bacterium]